LLPWSNLLVINNTPSASSLKRIVVDLFIFYNCSNSDYSGP
jgi:hypothetical protein